MTRRSTSVLARQHLCCCEKCRKECNDQYNREQVVQNDCVSGLTPSKRLQLENLVCPSPKERGKEAAVLQCLSPYELFIEYNHLTYTLFPSPLERAFPTRKLHTLGRVRPPLNPTLLPIKIQNRRNKIPLLHPLHSLWIIPNNRHQVILRQRKNLSFLQLKCTEIF